MRIHHLGFILTACACMLVPAAGLGAAMGTPTPAPTATPAPTPAPPLSPLERTFVDTVTRDLQTRFTTTKQAAAAGYYRYNNEDETGAISWVNTSYWKSDPQHPAQLWYDINGRLIGADFSYLQADSVKAQTMWGVSASRFIAIEQHVHYGLKQPDGSVKYGAGYGAKTAAKFGVPLANPTAADIVKIGKAKDASQVAFVFEYPAIWDLMVWLVPNPLGAFAEFNPDVKPSKSAETSM
ncbi:MAG TPA: hypothetical protein VKF82_06180 [Candidatus Eremiobacteraceae bacterium]|nr:hypothetical protein [Candidatus Eremiobacteraceae bacterium]